MPVNKSEHASIVLSKAQFMSLATLLQEAGILPGVASAAIEETNITNTVAVTTQRGTTLIDHDGNPWALGGRGADHSLKSSRKSAGAA